MVHLQVEHHMQFFSHHLRIVILKLEKVQKRAVRVMELIFCKAQSSRLEMFKNLMLGMSKSLKVQTGQIKMENKMNWGLIN